MTRIAWLLVFLPVLACAHLTPPEAGGPRWLSVTGRHVRLTTDLDGPTAEREVRDLDALLAAMLRAAWARDDADIARIELVAFRSVHGLRVFASESSMSYVSFTQRSIATVEGMSLQLPGRGKVLVTHAEGRLAETPAVSHAFAKIAAQIHPGPMPWWVVQGVAMLLASGEVEKGVFEIGPLNYEVLNSIQTSVVSLRDPRVKHGAVELPVAMTLVYWLRANPAAFQQFTGALAAGEPEVAAFARAFPSETAERVEGEIDYHAWKQPPVPLLAIPLEPQPQALAVAELSPAQVHALWASIHYTRQRDREGDAQLQAALALDPQDADAELLAILRAPPEEQPARLAELIARAPENPRPCRVAMGTVELDAGLRLLCADRVLAEDGNQVEARYRKSAALLELDRLDEAAASLRAARQLCVPVPMAAPAAVEMLA